MEELSQDVGMIRRQHEKLAEKVTDDLDELKHKSLRQLIDLE